MHNYLFQTHEGYRLFQSEREMPRKLHYEFGGAVDEETKTERNTNVVSSFMEHCKKEGIEIPDTTFESYFNA